MTVHAPTDDGALVGACAAGSHLIHLARLGTPESVCGQRVDKRRAAAGFRHLGCRACLDLVQLTGRTAFLKDGTNAWINLQRINRDHLPDHVPLTVDEAHEEEQR